MDLKEFDDIRPYTDEELPIVFQRLLNDQQFCAFAERVAGADKFVQLSQMANKIQTIEMFQMLAINPFLDRIVNQLAQSFDSEGVLESVADNGCTYISNHRDIIVDVALLDKILLDHHQHTVEIGIGNNLLIYPWIEDLVRINKSFIVRRDGQGRELMLHSIHMSQYIHFAISDLHHSIWIAQRQGRAKDSNDRTQESVIKMLAMGSKKNFTESLKEINIRPLTISYEYDPCDFLKAKEAMQHLNNPDFKKSQADDMLNMKIGVNGYKGHIFYHCSDNLNPTIDRIAATTDNRNQQATLIAQAIDQQIHAHYRFFPINYIAHDMLKSQNTFADHYTAQDQEKVQHYINSQLSKIELDNKDNDFLINYFLKMYANPLINHLASLQ